MDSDLKADLIHHVTMARGDTTKQLFADIQTLRANKRWQHAEPEDVQALLLMLLSLQAEGHLRRDVDAWWPASHVQRAEARRGFEEVRQQGLFT